MQSFGDYDKSTATCFLWPTQLLTYGSLPRPILTGPRVCPLHPLSFYTSHEPYENQVITYSLTFLVGAGGNASAQSAVIVIRGIATRQVNRRNELKLLLREILIGAAMGFVLSFCGFLRVFIFSRDFVASAAIGSCLFLIVVLATTIGAILPFILLRLGTDPAHAGPAVQVIMDIIGVATCCIVCTAAFAIFEGPPSI
jgi:Mg/Co/Ni transporter MgtE